jgi:hypothetical protein
MPGRGQFLRCDRPQMARPKDMAPDAASPFNISEL